MIEAAGAAVDQRVKDAYVYGGLSGAARVPMDGDAPLGTCLLSAIIGCAELAARGLPVSIQIGAAYHPRLPVERANDPGAVYGYAWEPDNPVSARMMADGGAPEFHAWCGVMPGKCDGAMGGLVVDYCAWQFPHMAEKMLGQTWEVARPPRCFHFGPDGSGVLRGVYYHPTMEAVGSMMMYGRKMVAALCRMGLPTDDLWAEVGGPPRQVVRNGEVLLDPAEALTDAAQCLRLVRLQCGLRPGESNVGNW